jgi:competence protein ComEC
MSLLAYCTVWFVIGVLTYPHIDHLIQSLQPKEIIADLSNYKSYIKRWGRNNKSNGIELHETSSQRAFKLNP